MKSCEYFRELIDEADKPDLLSFDVSEHLGECGECERFAVERAALRKLLTSSARVSAPMNFDAMVNSRLAERKARRSFWWLNSPGYLRLGAATAGLLVMFFAAQYAGLFSDQSNRTAEQRGGVTTSKPSPAPPSDVAAAPVIPPSPSEGLATVSPSQVDDSPGGRPQRTRSVDGRTRRTIGLTADDGGVVLVRAQNGGMDFPMPTVSVGAQPLLYVSAGQRPAVRTVGTSF